MKRPMHIAFAVGLGVAGLLSTGTAFADGMPSGATTVYSAPSFAGFYVGGHVSHVVSNGGPIVKFFDIDDGPKIMTTPSSGGTVGGVQGGYNFQRDRYLVGVEVDWSGANHSNSVLDGDDFIRARLTDLASVR